MERYHMADHVTKTVFRQYLLISTCIIDFNNCACRIQLIKTHRFLSTFSIFNLCKDNPRDKDKLMQMALDSVKPRRGKLCQTADLTLSKFDLFMSNNRGSNRDNL